MGDTMFDWLLDWLCQREESDKKEIKKRLERLERHYEELADAIGEGKIGQKHDEIVGIAEEKVG